MLPAISPRVASRTATPSLNFFDDLQAQFNRMMQPPPTFEEAELYCRDDESAGCTVEMLELLEKRKAKPVKAPKPRWSEEIDDAVVKPE